ncbi:MAG: hypothetical protein JWO86_7137 [Myxococcaceae bacterium]|nr:hypothetical protein [Myxococcaceae bacterium]
MRPMHRSSTRRFVTLAALAGGVVALGAAGLGVLDACVPADTRPVPGSLLLTVSPSPAVASGVTTVDGWDVSFEHVVVSIGQASLGNGCDEYSQADYERVVDVKTSQSQKLSILYGIGKCDLRFRVVAPTVDAVLGDNVSEDVKTQLRTPGGDPYVPLGGVAIDVAGTAVRGAVTKHFHLQFRPRVRYGNCRLVADAGPGIDLASSAALTYDIRIEGEAVLRDDVDAAVAALRFDPFASADQDGDGNVTLDELRLVPIANVRDGGAFEAGTYVYDDDAGLFRAGQSIPVNTLGDYVYELLLPSLPRFRDTGNCTVGIGRNNGGPG